MSAKYVDHLIGKDFQKPWEQGDSLMGFGVHNFADRGRTRGGGKFVTFARLDDDDGGMVVFSDFSLDAEHRGIVSRWERLKGEPLSSSGLGVSGGGLWKLMDGGKILCLYGESAAFGRFDSARLAVELTPGSVFYEEKIIYKR